MSRIALEPNSSGSGVFTIASPNSNTSRVLNLPDAAGTVSVADSNGIISANGIAFPATQSASANANTLDDYEEGTFTPTLVGSSTNPTVTYTTQSGSYTKVGNMVTVYIRIQASSISGGSVNMRIGGLPFTSGSARSGCGVGYFSNINLDSGYTYVGLYPSVNATTMDFAQSGDNVSALLIPTASFGALDIVFTCSYAV
jgi:hypothetical protein